MSLKDTNPTMKLVDVHCHINHHHFKNMLSETLERASIAGVKAIVCAGVNSATNREIMVLSNKYPLIKAALGMYPLDAVNHQSPAPDEQGLARDSYFDVDAELAYIRAHAKDIVAIGEVGLDFSEPIHVELQKEIFRKVIRLAKDVDKVLVIHSRKAESDVIDMLEKEGAKKVVLHCFGGRKSLVKRAAALGYSFSIPSVVARLNHFEMVIQEVNINQLLTETDAPWLSPEVGRRSEPADVVKSIEKIAQIKGFNLTETADTVFLNYMRLFG